MKKVLTAMMGFAIVSLAALSGCGATNTTQSTSAATGAGSQANSTGGNGASSGPRGRGFGGGMQLTTVSKVLNIQMSTLMTDLKNGQSIAQLASKQGISTQKLTSDLEADYKQTLDNLVKNGRISSTQEQTMISRYNQSLPKMISTPGLPNNVGNRPPGSSGSRGQRGNWGNYTGNQSGRWNGTGGWNNSNSTGGGNPPGAGNTAGGN